MNLPLKPSQKVVPPSIRVAARSRSSLCLQFAASVRGLLLSCLPVGLLCAACSSVAAQKAEIKVVEQIWGFDGRVQPGQFNPFSVLLDNQTDQPIDARASFQRTNFVSPVGGQYVEPVFIAPTARRWVTFYPYIAGANQDEWQLSLDNNRLAKFTQPRAAVKLPSEQKDPPPQIIILDRASQMQSQPTAVKHLPENIFPPYATATAGLHTVFLDHIPDWEAPRQQAFLSWLKQGGRLHLLKDSRDEYPRFTGDLAEISQPFERYSVGRGVVIRHAFQRGDVSEDLVRRAAVVDALADKDADYEAEIAKELEDNPYYAVPNYDMEASTIDDTFFHDMRELTLPEHAWWLIFLLALAYIGLIFPGCYVLSKNKELHFLTTYGAIVGLSVVFSVLFLFIGRRGYGETTTLHTLAVARAEDDSHWNVLQWNALFVTSGDNYAATVPDQQFLAATGDMMDESNAQLRCGNQGGIVMRIPPFSSQTFISRRRITGDPWKLTVTDYNGNPSNLISLKIDVGGDFPIDPQTRYYVLQKRSVYELRYDSDSKQLRLLGAKRSLAAFCRPKYDNTFTGLGMGYQEQTDQTEQEIFFDDSLALLAHRSLYDDMVTVPARFQLPDSRLRLFVYAPVTEEFEMNVTAGARRNGRVLYIRDLSLGNNN